MEPQVVANRSRPPLWRRLLAVPLVLGGGVALAVTALHLDASYAFRTGGAERRMDALVWLVAALAMVALAAWLRRGLLLPLLVALALGLAGAWGMTRAILAETRAKRTVADLLDLGTAIEAYRFQEGHLPRANDARGLVALLSPKYITVETSEDSWGFPLRVEWVEAGGEERLLIGSPGKYGRWQRARLRDYTPAVNRAESDDIVWSSGPAAPVAEGRKVFVQAPAGFVRDAP